MALGFDLIFRKFAIGKFSIAIYNIILAVALIFIGFFLGKIVYSIIKKSLEKLTFQKKATSSFIELFLTVVKWAIYIFFLNLALEQLGIPELTGWLTNILIVIPALVAGLVLIAAGFAIAAYLKDIIENSSLIYGKILSTILFYFVLYVFSVFALKTALISLDSMIVNIILIILTGVVSAGIAYWHIRLFANAKKK